MFSGAGILQFFNRNFFCSVEKKYLVPSGGMIAVNYKVVFIFIEYIFIVDTL